MAALCPAGVWSIPRVLPGHGVGTPGLGLAWGHGSGWDDVWRGGPCGQGWPVAGRYAVPRGAGREGGQSRCEPWAAPGPPQLSLQCRGCRNISGLHVKRVLQFCSGEQQVASLAGIPKGVGLPSPRCL